MKLPRTPFPENNIAMPYQYEPGTIVVGIDLGTTNTVCFVYDGSGYEVIKFGNLTVLPSYVQYKRNGTVVCGGCQGKLRKEAVLGYLQFEAYHRKTLQQRTN